MVGAFVIGIAVGGTSVIGLLVVGATKAAMPIYKNAGILVMSPSATNPGLTQSGDYPMLP